MQRGNLNLCGCFYLQGRAYLTSKEKFELHPNEIALFLLRIFVLYLHWQVLHDQLLLNLPRAGRQQG